MNGTVIDAQGYATNSRYDVRNRKVTATDPSTARRPSSTTADR
jgi:hypothetical protein